MILNKLEITVRSFPVVDSMMAVCDDGCLSYKNTNDCPWYSAMMAICSLASV